VSARRVAAVVVWWCAFWGLWFAFTGEWNRIEWVAAACAATVASAVAALVIGRGLVEARVALDVVLAAAVVPWRVVQEFGILVVFLFRSLAARGRLEGQFRSLEWPSSGKSPADRGRRAFISIAATISPNSYVVHMDEDDDVVLVHELVAQSKRSTLLWTNSK
jgi:hypothetical protein